MKILIFAGAGCSVELGVPAMRELAVELLTHIETATVQDDALLANLRKRVEEVDSDLETVIQDIDAIHGAEEVLPSYGAALDPVLIESARVTRAEIEWFVRYRAERAPVQIRPRAGDAGQRPAPTPA